MEVCPSLGSRGVGSGGGSWKRSNKPNNLLFLKTWCICSIYDMVSPDSANQHMTIQCFGATFLIFWSVLGVFFGLVSSQCMNVVASILCFFFFEDAYHVGSDRVCHWTFVLMSCCFLHSDGFVLSFMLLYWTHVWFLHTCSVVFCRRRRLRTSWCWCSKFCTVDIMDFLIAMDRYG